MSFELGPCAPWTTSDLVTECTTYADVDPTVLEGENGRIAVASGYLYRLSGLQFPGECTDTIRPLWGGGEALESRTTTSGPFIWTRLGHAYAFDAHVWPVKTITEVKVDGVPLPLSNFMIQDGRWLIRRDGLSWPISQLLNHPTTDVGTWSITYTWGQAPPPEGVLAASTLAGELSLACGTEDQCNKCRLSKRVQQVTRQGVSMSLLDPFQFLDKGRLGILEIDAFLTAYNPNQLMGEPTIGSPDIRPVAVRDTWLG